MRKFTGKKAIKMKKKKNLYIFMHFLTVPKRQNLIPLYYRVYFGLSSLSKLFMRQRSDTKGE